MKNQPSEMFLSAIMDGYLAEALGSDNVTPSAIWDHVCMACIRRSDGFREMFAWDVGRSQNVNRIGTITDCIKAGLVPGLVLAMNAKGRQIVKEAR